MLQLILLKLVPTSLPHWLCFNCYQTIIHVPSKQTSSQREILVRHHNNELLELWKKSEFRHLHYLKSPSLQLYSTTWHYDVIQEPVFQHLILINTVKNVLHCYLNSVYSVAINNCDFNFNPLHNKKDKARHSTEYLSQCYILPFHHSIVHSNCQAMSLKTGPACIQVKQPKLVK